MKILSPMLAHCLLFWLVLFVSLKDVEAALPMRLMRRRTTAKVRAKITPEKHNVEISLDKKGHLTSLLR